MKNKKGFALSVLLVFFICGVTIPLFMTNHTKVKADTITDLTNTTWIISNSPSITSGYGRFYLDISCDDITTGGTYTGLAIGYRFNSYSGGGDFVNGSNAFLLSQYSSNNIDGYTITINDGPDVSNSLLISWLQSNATQQLPPTPTGTQITHKYWAPYGVITITDDTEYSDNDIEYTVLFNEYNNSYADTVQTGLIFKGVQTQQTPPYSYIESINGQGINILYLGETNNLNNTMWLEFTPGDYMDSGLYNYMDLWGLWFDDDGPYLVGINQGYVEGVEHGRALGQADGVEYTGLITGIFNGLGGLLSIQVFPNITIGLLIGLPLLLGALIIILKILRG